MQGLSLRQLPGLLVAVLWVTTSSFAMERLPDRPASERGLAQAEKQAGAGDFRGAALSYETLADQSIGEMKSRLYLRAAHYWLNADEADKAQTALGKVAQRLPASDAALLATVAADLALRSNQAERALSEVDQVALPLPTDLAPELLRLRSAAQFALGRPVPAINSALDREHLLNSPKDIAQNHEMIFSGLRQSASKGIDLQVPAGVTGIVAGWLELARIEASLGTNPFALRDALADWQRRYPGHPAATLDDVRSSLENRERATVQAFPNQIAVLLPLSGRLQAAGTAVRDGLVAAALEREASARPILNFYDTAQGAATAYQQALAGGASFVIGPLSKEDVSALAATSLVSIPTLALNYLVPAQAAPGLLFQFALDPEEEAREVAARIVQDGLHRGIAILPNSDWGQRVSKAFADELAARGGTIAKIQYYDTNTRDYSGVITPAMLINESRARASALNNALGMRLEAEARSRGDVEFVFIGAQPAQGRLLRPALRFHIADQDMPVYATSDIYESSDQANNDLNDVRFPDMPWMIGSDERIADVRAKLRTYWPNTRERLFAFGYDALRLVPLISSAQPQGAVFSGATGRLAIDQNGRVRRQLDWARISAGHPVPLAADASTTATLSR